MRIDAAIRLLSLATVVWAARNFDLSHLYNFVFAYGLGHCVFGYIYGWKKIKPLTMHPRGILLTTIFTVVSVILFITSVPLVLIFGAHHIFNEVYAGREGSDKLPVSKHLNLSRLLLISSGYAWATRANPALAAIPPQILFIFFVSCFFFYLLTLLTSNDVHPLRRVELFLFDNITTVLALGTAFYGMDLIYIVMYHFVFWTLYPFAKLVKSNRFTAYKFVLEHAIVVFVFWAFSPLGLKPVCSWPIFVGIFSLNAILHIVLSMLFSSGHPQWIRQLIQIKQSVQFGKQEKMPVLTANLATFNSKS